MKLAVIGAGYVGLTTAVAFAFTGHDVVGIDIDRRVDLLNSGVSPMVMIGVTDRRTAEGVARMVVDRSGVDAAGLEYSSLARQPEMALSR